MILEKNRLQYITAITRRTFWKSAESYGHSSTRVAKKLENNWILPLLFPKILPVKTLMTMNTTTLERGSRKKTYVWTSVEWYFSSIQLGTKWSVRPLWKCNYNVPSGKAKRSSWAVNPVTKDEIMPLHFKYMQDRHFDIAYLLAPEIHMQDCGQHRKRAGI